MNKLIHNYLKSIPDLSNQGIIDLKEKILFIKNSIGHNSFNLRLLNQSRILASNSLTKEDSLNLLQWNKANVLVIDSVKNQKELSFNYIKSINQLVLGREVTSKVRSREIYTADEAYLSPDKLEQYLFDFSETILKLNTNDPLLKAFLVYKWIATLHPFSNGNGRTARLAADWILIENSMLPICFASSISSHVAQTIGGKQRSSTLSYICFLSGIYLSYKIASVGRSNSITS